MAKLTDRLGARLRPHVKPHKVAEIGQLQTHGHFGGIMLSTLAEAHHFAASGFQDIVYAGIVINIAKNTY